MINLTLSIEQVNTVLGSLAKEPYAQVAALIDDIRQQGIPQAQALQAAAEKEAAQNPDTVTDVK